MKKLILSTLVSFSIYAGNHQNLIVDPYFSPYSGADDLIMAHQVLEDLHLTHFGKPLFSKTPLLEKVGRFSELFFLWDPKLQYFIRDLIYH